MARKNLEWRDLEHDHGPRADPGMAKHGPRIGRTPEMAWQNPRNGRTLEDDGEGEDPTMQGPQKMMKAQAKEEIAPDRMMPMLNHKEQVV